MLRFTDPVPEDVASGFWSEGLGRRVLAWMRSIQEAVNGAQGTPDPPSEIQAGAVAAAGESQAPAPSDHTHSVDTASPSKVQYDGAVAEGTGTALKRADAREVLADGIATGDVLVWQPGGWVPSTAVGAPAARIGNAVTAGKATHIISPVLPAILSLEGFFSLEGRFPNTLLVHSAGIKNLITTSNGSAAKNQYGIYNEVLNGGYTGPQPTYGIYSLATIGGAGQGYGVWGQVSSASTDNAYGLAGSVSGNGSGQKFGLFAQAAGTVGPQIGVAGWSRALGSIKVGGFFSVGNASQVIDASAALIADNQDQAVDIFKGRDANVDVFTINDGGGFTLFKPAFHAFGTKFQLSDSQGVGIVYTLPIDDGVVGAVLSTDGAGVLEWAALDSRVATQFDKTNTTLANVTGLTANVKAGRKYAFVATLFFDADAVGGQKWAMGGTATATAIIYQITSEDNAALATVIQSRQTALGGSAGQAGCVAGIATIRGLITVNAAGTLTCQFSQNAAGGTSSVLVGSFLHLSEVP